MSERLIYRHPDGTIVEMGGYCNAGSAKMYDQAGDEIKPPECEVCRGLKCMVIGKESFSWVCMGCKGAVIEVDG